MSTNDLLRQRMVEHGERRYSKNLGWEKMSEGEGNGNDCGCTTARLVGKEPACDEKHPDGRYICTREADHSGPHHACGPSQHPIVSWTNHNYQNVKPDIKQAHLNASSVKDEIIVSQIGTMIENPVDTIKGLTVGLLLPNENRHTGSD